MDDCPAALPSYHGLGLLSVLNEGKCEGIVSGWKLGLASVGSAAPTLLFRVGRAVSRYWKKAPPVARPLSPSKPGLEGTGQTCQEKIGNPADFEPPINNK